MSKYQIKTDQGLNPALKKQVVGLRSMILDQANKVHLPPRFTLVMSDDEPNGVITDTKTGRKTSPIGLYAMAEVRGALAELFG